MKTWTGAGEWMQILHSAGMLSEDQIRHTLAAAEEQNLHPLDLLIQHGLCTQDDLRRAAAWDCGMDDLPDIPSVDPEALSRLSRRHAMQLRALPFRKNGDTLEIAIDNPYDLSRLDALRNILHHTLQFILIPQATLQRHLLAHYEVSENLALHSTSSSENTASDHEAARIVSAIIRDALVLGASDIHLEPTASHTHLRYRIDGVLQPAPYPPKHLENALINRIKVLSRLDLAEKRLPRDGRIAFTLNDSHRIHLRVSTIPTMHGESVAMRILDRPQSHSLDQLGLQPDEARLLHQLLKLNGGMLLVTGPTGCGKTTTLYSCLDQINDNSRKIITIEDPIECHLSGINQMQVKPEVGMTFASALRAMLRQSPDVLMVGEIRDLETAQIALQAALTGHLVLSTLHTPDAPSSIVRLLNMGVQPYLIASALHAVIAQRLLRVRCTECLHHLTDPHYDHAHCPICHGTGYKGRTGIFEILPFNDTIRATILEKTNTPQLRLLSRQSGARTLRESGEQKVSMGFTSQEELDRVVVA